MDAATFRPAMRDLHDMGVRHVAPPPWLPVTAADGKSAPSVYAVEARAAGLEIIA